MRQIQPTPDSMLSSLSTVAHMPKYSEKEAWHRAAERSARKREEEANALRRAKARDRQYKELEKQTMQQLKAKSSNKNPADQAASQQVLKRPATSKYPAPNNFQNPQHFGRPNLNTAPSAGNSAAHSRPYLQQPQPQGPNRYVAGAGGHHAQHPPPPQNIYHQSSPMIPTGHQSGRGTMNVSHAQQAPPPTTVMRQVSPVKRIHHSGRGTETLAFPQGDNLAKTLDHGSNPHSGMAPIRNAQPPTQFQTTPMRNPQQQQQQHQYQMSPMRSPHQSAPPQRQMMVLQSPRPNFAHQHNPHLPPNFHQNYPAAASANAQRLVGGGGVMEAVVESPHRVLGGSARNIFSENLQLATAAARSRPYHSERSLLVGAAALAALGAGSEDFVMSSSFDNGRGRSADTDVLSMMHTSTRPRHRSNSSGEPSPAKSPRKGTLDAELASKLNAELFEDFVYGMMVAV